MRWHVARGGEGGCRAKNTNQQTILDLNDKSAYTNYKINLIKPTGHVMHQQFNIQQLYALPTLYLYVLYLSENKQWLVPLTA